jgi:predicted O-linked N-acetylglucosamine transferase (SPINDLY family)
LTNKANEAHLAEDFETYYQQGNELRELNRLEEALASYEKALAINKNHAGANFKRGSTLQRLNRLEDALVCYETVLAIDPHYADAYFNYGTILQSYGRLEDAIEFFNRSLAINPNDADAYNNIGILQAGLNQLDDALNNFDRSIKLNPKNSVAFYNLGKTLIDLNRLDEAVTSLYRAMSLNPDLELLLGLYLHTKMKLCDWTSLHYYTDQFVVAVSKMKLVTAPFPLLGLIDQPQLHQISAKVYSETQHPKTDVLGPHVKRMPHHKIRIGYYSADFHNHATSYLMAELFEVHNRSKFEIYGFSFGPNFDDEMRRRIAPSFDKFFEVNSMSDLQIAKLSRDIGIDIAVDLKGYTTDSRAGIFAKGAAPIQVNYLGYPGTMGSAYIDYIIADRIVIPEDQRLSYFEKVVYLPHSYQVNDSKRSISDKQFTRKEFGLPESSFVFCCFNNSYKILPDTFDVWMRILKAVPGSVLWLLEDHSTISTNLRREARVRGVNESRLVFAKRMPMDEHLARQKLANLFLDTLPYNAHTTTSDALWAGLPVLTVMGTSFASRVAASLLNAINLPELITQTKEEYEQLAIRLATDGNILESLKEKLENNKANSPLFNCNQFSRHLEVAYEAMYERHQSGLPPDAIVVQA